MKTVITILSVMLYVSVSCAQTGSVTPKEINPKGVVKNVPNVQNTGGITAKEINPRAGVENHYVYQPPKGIIIPENLQVLVAYESAGQYYQKTIPVTRSGNTYQFSFKAPDSTTALMLAMADGKKEAMRSNSLMVAPKKIVDNNSEGGFILRLYDRKGKSFDFEKIKLPGLIDDFAQYELQVKPLPNTAMILMYEDAYKSNPALRKDDSYLEYLTLLYKEKPEVVKPQLLAYANQLIQTSNDEAKWLNAKRIYRRLKMDDEKQQLENKILSVFPNGKEAEQIFWDDFYEQKDKTEQSVLSNMAIYFNRFKDSSYEVKDKFYSSIVGQFAIKKDWIAVLEYENLIHNKLIIPNTYNYYAWKNSGKQLDNPATDLPSSKIISKRSIEAIDALMKRRVTVDEYDEDLQAVRNMFINTYALILYKLGEYDSAFYYQDVVYKQGKGALDAEGMERYAAYAEKVKGLNYTRQFLEEQLLKGINSSVMQKQLQSIYAQLNLPQNQLDKLKEINDLVAMQKSTQTIKARFGTLKAKDFALKNINGETVSLSSFKGKIVVLDFWATWCVPCKASFPAMQKLINRYKADSDVVFLFIDVWENATAVEIQTEVAKYIKDKEYSFNVLFDERNKVVKDYRIEGIPSKFIINKKGDIIFMPDINKKGDVIIAGEDTEDIPRVIETAKK